MLITSNTASQWDDLLSRNDYLYDFGYIDLLRVKQAKGWWSGDNKIINIGSGQGYLEKQFNAEIESSSVDWTSLDISTKGLERINELFPKVNTVEASLLSLPFADASFELTYCMEVLEHISPELLGRAYSELKRVTSDKIVISVPVYERRPLKESPVGHLRKLTPELIESELKKYGLTIVNKRYLFAFSKRLYGLKSLVSKTMSLRRPNVAMYLCQK